MDELFNSQPHITINKEEAWSNVHVMRTRWLVGRKMGRGKVLRVGGNESES